MKLDQTAHFEKDPSLRVEWLPNGKPVQMPQPLLLQMEAALKK